MLNDFDRAFTNKIKAWYPNNTQFADTSVVFNVAYNLSGDASTKLEFPLINIYRPSGFSVNKDQTFSARKRGIEYYLDEVNNKNVLARMIVVTLPYQIDIYAKTPEDRNDIAEELIMALNLDQKLIVTQHDQVNDNDYIESYDITYVSGPEDLSEFNSDDRIYHYALAFDIQNARLLNFRKSDAVLEVDITNQVEE